MFNCLFKCVVAVLFISFCVFRLQIISAPPSQPLTQPLPAVSAPQSISKEWLINSTLSENNDFSASWLDNDHLIYDSN